MASLAKHQRALIFNFAENIRWLPPQRNLNDLFERATEMNEEAVNSPLLNGAQCLKSAHKKIGDFSLVARFRESKNQSATSPGSS
jgi:hypothetical protein